MLLLIDNKSIKHKVHDRVKKIKTSKINFPSKIIKMLGVPISHLKYKYLTFSGTIRRIVLLFPEYRGTKHGEKPHRTLDHSPRSGHRKKVL